MNRETSYISDKTPSTGNKLYLFHSKPEQFMNNNIWKTSVRDIIDKINKSITSQN